MNEVVRGSKKDTNHLKGALIFSVVPSHPISFLFVGFCTTPLKVNLLAGDLRTSQLGKSR